jgi:DNA polymerase delta subunit 1
MFCGPELGRITGPPSWAGKPPFYYTNADDQIVRARPRFAAVDRMDEPIERWTGRYNLRVPAPANRDDLQFQIVDAVVSDFPGQEMDYQPRAVASAAFLASVPAVDHAAKWRDAQCTVSIFATEACGASALISVAGFRPHLTYQVSPQSRQRLLSELGHHARVRPELLTCKSMRLHHLYGWEPDPADPTQKRLFDCTRVYFPTISSFRAALRHGPVMGCEPWEGKVDPIMMFFDQTGLAPCGWMRVARSTAAAAQVRRSHCGIELQCDVEHVAAVDRMDMAPLLVASVDIECYSATGAFPDMEKPEDRIGIIGTSFWRVGTPVDSSVTVLLCVGACDPVQGAHVEAYATEADMLEAWRDLMSVHADPDVVIGYNTFGFDYKYISHRADKVLSCPRFAYTSRFAAQPSRPAVKQLSSNALGDNEMHILGWAGRVDVDLMGYIRAQHKLQKYSLNSVAEHFLGDKKVDLPYKELFRCMDGTSAEAMARACFYCAEDCRLPIKLLKRLEVVPSMVEMSRVTYTTLNQLVFRGQQIKVYNQLVRAAHAQNCVLNSPPAAGEDEGYQGATVIDPKPGFYDTPVATLDFASLYPSIMMAHNLCFSTQVIAPEHLGVAGVEYETHRPSDAKEFTFVLSTPGVLPEILRELLAARKTAKRLMAQATDPEVQALYNARQLALKISCNSVYGFTGAAKRGMYADVAMADSVTCVGRGMIETTAGIVEAEGHEVIYGDTDSVMIRFRDPGTTLAQSAQLGEALAAQITDRFRLGIKLEYEKSFFPYLLIAKKRYIGVKYSLGRDGTLQLDGVDAKGVELVRRDNCPFAKAVYKDVVDALLLERSPARAVESLRANLDTLVADRVALSDFVLTKQLKRADSYVNQMQPHLLVAKCHYGLYENSSGLFLNLGQKKFRNTPFKNMVFTAQPK